MIRMLTAAVIMLSFVACLHQSGNETGTPLRAGAAAVNIDPPQLPALRNGGFVARTVGGVVAPLFVRTLVLDNGIERVAICVVDSCMLDRELCDRAKALVARDCGLREDQILISATHTHSAPSAMRALGCPPDPAYTEFLPPKIAESIELAVSSLKPAKAGWGVVNAAHYTNCRRWIYLPHAVRQDPYGNLSVRAMMHPGHLNSGTAGPAGPIDPDLTVLAIRDHEDRPLALLANFSMHYFGGRPFAPDYTGKVCQLLEAGVADSSGKKRTPFVALMSQGTSGDLHYMDYGLSMQDQPFKGKPDGFERYCGELADMILRAEREIDFKSLLPLAMEETRITFQRRMPDEKRLEWARPIVAATEGLPRDRVQVLAEEALWINENPSEELKLQALRLGDLGITAIPNEVFGITGLKIKMQSPLQPTMNIELANGSAGYIPPPEQHFLGGYTTWPARTAGLEIGAEPAITESVLSLLEKVADRPRRISRVEYGGCAKSLLAASPVAYWPLDIHSGKKLPDISGNGREAQLDDGYALFLPGVDNDDFTRTERGSRAVHFAGGRALAQLLELKDSYSVSLWFWNAMPHDARIVTGYLFSRGGNHSSVGDHLGIGGKNLNQGRLFFYNGDERKEIVAGETPLKIKHWHHVLLVREGNNVRVYLDGAVNPEISATISVTCPEHSCVFVGGRCDNKFNFEGKVDEVALFDKAFDQLNDRIYAVKREGR
jgi:hypothetical protein